MNLIHEIERAGMTIRLKHDGKLLLSPAERLTPEIRQRILDNRPAIVAALQASTRALDEAATDAEELARLVRLCGERYRFTEAEHAEALQVALADPVSALTCFRAIAREVPMANSGHNHAAIAA
ncbi:MAG: hypothetical protein M1527_04775 [Gammaproteobacteria bacterium]|nr:hypothetical protein [Gammaproteobacteria bacterium]